MTLLDLRHSTDPSNRDSIQEQGLLPRRPADHNYPGCYYQPEGVYFAPRNNSYSSWDGTPSDVWSQDDDVWQTAYCGPAINDPLIPGAIVVQHHIPPERLTLESTYR